jgi:molybdopterin-guanine dinucleotide biosynthesis protein A
MSLPFTPAVVILAGGKSSRLASGSKANATLAGKPMIEHVIERIKQQAKPVIISTQDDETGLSDNDLVFVPDAVKRHRGPLTGLYSAMQYLVSGTDIEWLLLCPCDAPFVPRNLAERLYAEALRSDKPVSVACYEEVPQPTFSLWNRSVFPQIKAAVLDQGKGGLMYMLDQLPYCAVDWPVERPAPFFNVNTKADLQMAERLLDLDGTKD